MRAHRDDQPTTRFELVQELKVKGCEERERTEGRRKGGREGGGERRREWREGGRNRKRGRDREDEWMGVRWKLVTGNHAPHTHPVIYIYIYIFPSRCSTHWLRDHSGSSPDMDGIIGCSSRISFPAITNCGKRRLVQRRLFTLNEERQIIIMHNKLSMLY